MRNNDKNPKISVILSIYNGEYFLDKSIESILNQTYKNFELIIVNDCSTDKTEQLIFYYKKKDSRIRIIKNSENIGLTKSLILGINASKTNYIFRQDVDEISYPDRFKSQINILTKDDIVAVGANSLDIYESEITTEWGYIKDDDIKKNIPIKTIFPHGSSAFKKNIYFKVGGYDQNLYTCQDFDLWNKLIKHGKIVMIKEIKLSRKIHNETITQNKKLLQFIDSSKIKFKYRTSTIKMILSILKHFIYLIIPNKITLRLKKNLK